MKNVELRLLSSLEGNRKIAKAMKDINYKVVEEAGRFVVSAKKEIILLRGMVDIALGRHINEVDWRSFADDIEADRVILTDEKLTLLAEKSKPMLIKFSPLQVEQLKKMAEELTGGDVSKVIKLKMFGAKVAVLVETGKTATRQQKESWRNRILKSRLPQ